MSVRYKVASMSPSSSAVERQTFNLVVRGSIPLEGDFVLTRGISFLSVRPASSMDRMPDYGSGGSRFESWVGRMLLLSQQQIIDEAGRNRTASARFGIEHVTITPQPQSPISFIGSLDAENAHSRGLPRDRRKYLPLYYPC